MADQRVVCAGYTVVDVCVDDSTVISHRTGGTAANVASNLAWLGRGQVDLAVRIGSDPAGRLIQAEMRAFGVGVEHVELDPEVRTPVLIHDVTNAREPRYLFSCLHCRRPSASFRPITTDTVREVCSPTPATFFFDRASAAALATAELVRASGGIVMFEPNGVGREQLTTRAIQIASIVKFSSSCNSRLPVLVDDGPLGQVQIRTEGAEGLLWRTVGQSWRRRRAHTCAIVDSAGAGDWVTSGFLHFVSTRGELSTRGIGAALDFGQAVAASSCEHIGARGMTAAPANAVRAQLAARGLSSQTQFDIALPHPGSDVACAMCLSSDPFISERTADLVTTAR
ncbi:carbohydrate kinase family protein [Antrihabitans spumae]|uniref:Carbohydrate kinase family protein n=1 Tax=Antrihabitans spumae TaxID=3373370 RepID=A0ABW7KQ30_9NOCA